MKATFLPSIISTKKLKKLLESVEIKVPKFEYLDLCFKGFFFILTDSVIFPAKKLDRGRFYI